MKEVIIYGGCFDPPHKGHLDCLQQLAELTNYSEVWMTPSGQRSDKNAKASYQQRVEMCQLALSHGLKLPQVKLSTIEKESQTEGTWELFQHLSQKYPDCRFILALGSELLNCLHKWKHPAQVKTLPLIVLKRPQQLSENQVDPEKHKELNIRTVVDTHYPLISSTSIRQLLASTVKAAELQTWLLPEVLTFINSQKLYFNDANSRQASCQNNL